VRGDSAKRRTPTKGDQGRPGSHARAELRGAARSMLGGCGSAWSGRARPGWCRAPVDAGAGAAGVRTAVDVGRAGAGRGSWARHRAVCARGGSAGSGPVACRARGLGGAGGSAAWCAVERLRRGRALAAARPGRAPGAVARDGRVASWREEREAAGVC
jgi:hypothetical protein